MGTDRQMINHGLSRQATIGAESTRRSCLPCIRLPRPCAGVAPGFPATHLRHINTPLPAPLSPSRSERLGERGAGSGWRGPAILAQNPAPPRRKAWGAEESEI